MKMWPAPEAIDRQAASKSQAKGSLLPCQSYQIYWSSIISIIQHSRHGYLDNKLITNHTDPYSFFLMTLLNSSAQALQCLHPSHLHGNIWKLHETPMYSSCTAVSLQSWEPYSFTSLNPDASSRLKVSWAKSSCCEVGGSPVANKILPLNMLTANTVFLPSTWRRLNCRLGVVFRSMQGLDQLNLDAVQTANGQNSIPEARIIKDSNRVNRSR